MVNFSVLRSNFAMPPCSIRPDVAVLELDIEHAGRIVRLEHRHRIFDDLAALGIELAQKLVAEIGVPGHALLIEDDVVRHRIRARQVVFGDHDLGRAALETRQRLERILPLRCAAQVDRCKEFRTRPQPLRIHHGALAHLLALLRLDADRAGRVACHALQHRNPFVGVVARLRDPLVGVAAGAAVHEVFLLRRAREARHPFAAGELGREVARLLELDRDRRAGFRNIHDLRAIELEADRPDAQRVLAGLELRGREREIARRVANHRDRDGRAILLGAHHHAFHGAFLGGGDLPGKFAGGLRKPRLRAAHHQHCRRDQQPMFHCHDALPKL